MSLRFGCRRARGWRAGLAGALAWLAGPGLAGASGLDVPQIGTTWSSPTTVDAAALYWNPALLAFAERGEVSLSLGFVGGAIGYQRDRLGVYQTPDSLQFSEPLDPAYIDPSKTGAAPGVRSPIAAPNVGAFLNVPVLRDRLALGFGVYVPYAAPLRFPDDGPQRFALRRAFIAVARVSAGLAVRVHRRVSLGASVSYELGTAQLSRVQDFAAVDLFADALANPPINQDNDFGSRAPSSVRELDVLARPFALTDAYSHAVSFNVAIAANPIDPLWLGLTYDHGSRLNLRGNFQLDMDDEFFTRDLAAQGLAFDPLVRGRGRLSFRLPKRLMLGVAYDLSSRLRLETSLAYVFWSELETYSITLDSPQLAQPELGIGSRARVDLARDWRGTVHAEVSARARLGPGERVMLSGTFGYHSPASPDATVDVSSPDGQRLLGAVGVGYAVHDRVTLLLDGEVQGIVSRRVTDSNFDLGNGTYDLVIGTVHFTTQVRFGNGGRASPRRGARRRGKAAPSPDSSGPPGSPSSPSSPSSPE